MESSALKEETLVICALAETCNFDPQFPTLKPLCFEEASFAKLKLSTISFNSTISACDKGAERVLIFCKVLYDTSACMQRSSKKNRFTKISEERIFRWHY